MLPPGELEIIFCTSEATVWLGVWQSFLSLRIRYPIWHNVLLDPGNVSDKWRLNSSKGLSKEHECYIQTTDRQTTLRKNAAQETELFVVAAMPPKMFEVTSTSWHKMRAGLKIVPKNVNFQVDSPVFLNAHLPLVETLMRGTCRPSWARLADRWCLWLLALETVWQRSTRYPSRSHSVLTR